MKTPTIPPVKLPESYLGQYRQQNNQQPAKTNDTLSDKVNSDTVTSPSTAHILLNKIETSNTQFHDIAKEIRSVKETMASIDAHLIKMRDALESVVKIYPPYPPGSSERIDALRQFTALRKMIDQLAGLPNSTNKGSAALNSEFSSGPLNISHYQVQAGSKGLKIPPLDVHSSDQQINDAIKKVTYAQQTMGSRQQEFVANANAIITDLT